MGCKEQRLHLHRRRKLDSLDRTASWIGALSVPLVAIVGYFRRKTLHYKVDQMNITLNKKIDDLALAVIKSK